MSVMNLAVAATARIVPTPTSPLGIVKPVRNQDGIYDIVADDGQTFKAYVDMTTDGGYWIQAAHFVAYPPTSLLGQNFIWKDEAIAGYSQDPTSRPSIPSGRIAKNPATHFLLVNENSTWVGLFGAWQRMALIPFADVIPLGGLEAVTPLGTKRVYGVQAGWNLNTIKTQSLGFWTQAGNQGPCGGANRNGADRCCVLAAPSAVSSPHADRTSLKAIYLRASNYRP